MCKTDNVSEMGFADKAWDVVYNTGFVGLVLSSAISTGGVFYGVHRKLEGQQHISVLEAKLRESSREVQKYCSPQSHKIDVKECTRSVNSYNISLDAYETASAVYQKKIQEGSSLENYIIYGGMGCMAFFGGLIALGTVMQRKREEETRPAPEIPTDQKKE